MRCRAAIATAGDQPLRISEIEVADPRPGEVRVRIEACGICRSDLHALDGGEDVRFPAVLGHEACGVVEALGAGVESALEGRRVVLSWTPACGQCAACRRHQVHLCAGVTMSAPEDGTLRWRGQELDRFMRLGAFAEHVVVPAAMAVPIDGAIPPEHACLLGCAVMTGFGAAVHTAGVATGDRVVVLGCGGVGLAAIQGARIAGAQQIVAIEPNAARREAALRLGATEALPAAGAVRAVQERTAGGADVAIECVGLPETMASAFVMLRPGGRAVVVGLPRLDARLELPAILLLQERGIRGSMYGSANPVVDFPMLVSLYEQGRLDLASLAGSVVPFAEIEQGIEQTRAGTAARVVLRFGDR